jgi:chromosome segregation ATPase
LQPHNDGKRRRQEARNKPKIRIRGVSEVAEKSDVKSGAFSALEMPVWVVLGGLALVAVLGLVGWQGNRSSLADLQRDMATQQAEFAATRAELEARLAETAAANGELEAVRAQLALATDSLETTNSRINQRLAVLGDYDQAVADFERTIEDKQAAIAALDARHAEIGTRLNRRLAALGQREQENAQLERQTVALQKAVTDTQARHAEIEERLRNRLVLVGEREQAYAQADRAAVNAEATVARLAARQAELEAELDETSARRDALVEEIAALENEQTDASGRAERARALLDEMRQTLEGVALPAGS